MKFTMDSQKVESFLGKGPHSYDNADGSHANLLVALRELNQRVEAVRKTITDNQTW